MRAPTEGNMASIYAEYWKMQEVIDGAERTIAEKDRVSARMEAEVGEGPANWYLVQAYPGDDLRAMRWLARRRFGVMRPEMPRNGGGGQAFFSGWIMVFTWNIEKMHSRILATPGVMNILCDPVTLRPVPIGDAFVQQVRKEAWKIEPRRQRVAVPDNPQSPAKPRRPNKREHKALSGLKKLMKQKGITLTLAQWEYVNTLEPRTRIALLNRAIAAPLVSLPGAA